jgi:hypothetical protein
VGHKTFTFSQAILFALTLLICLQFGIISSEAKKSTPKKSSPPVERVEFGKPMTFSVLRLSYVQCNPLCAQWIAADGEITDQTPAKLERLLANPNYRKFPILISSPGGRVYAAMKMGRLIRKYGMTTSVAQSSGLGCSLSSTCVTLGNKDDVVHSGYVMPNLGYCNSACSMMLLGGVVRIGGSDINIGLHQPHDDSQRWIDHYWDTWRIIKGKKHIISHRFVKRTYLKPSHIVGVTPQLKAIYLSYFKQMGGSPEILVEMAKASPNQMNYISASTNRRKELGLVTDNSLDVTALVSADHCHYTNGDLPPNCVFQKPTAVTPSVVEKPSEKCYILGGCSKTNTFASKATPALPEKCFILTGCAKEKPLQPEKPKCYVASGCN